MKKNSFFKCGLLALSLVLLLSFVAGCGSKEAPSDKQEKKDIQIVSSFYPMYIAALNVTEGVEGVKLTNMTKPQTGCLHDYQLTTEDMKLLSSADILIVNGGGMENFIDKVVKQQAKLKIVDASDGIPMIKDSAGEENPHVWVSVTNTIIQTNNIVRQLSAIDPAHKDKYEENGKNYIAKLEKLRSDMHKRLDKFAGKKIITFHEAFPYFAQEFQLNLAGVIEREPGSEPTPEELENTIKEIKELNIQVIFTEPQYSSKAAETIAQATGAKINVLDPVVTGDANIKAKNAYIEAMEKNAEVLEAALK